MTGIGTRMTTYGPIWVSYMHIISPRECNDTVLYLGTPHENFWEYEDSVRWFLNRDDKWTCGWD